MSIVDGNGIYLGAHPMVPVGLVGALELPDDLKDVWLPSIQVLGPIHLTSPRCSLKGFASLAWLHRCQILGVASLKTQTYSHIPAEDQFVDNR